MGRPSDPARAYIDGDDDLRSHRATKRNRYGVHNTPIHEVATLAQYRPKQTGHGTRSANGVRNIALAKPNLLSGHKISGNRGERYRQLGKLALDELGVEEVEQTVAFEQSASQPNVDKWQR